MVYDPEKRRAYYLANRERELAQSRQYAAANPDKVRELKRKSEEKNRERRRESKRREYLADPEKFRERNRRYYEANRERLLQYRREYAAANRTAVLSGYRRRSHGKHWELAYEAFWEAQDGRCYLCRDELDPEGYRQIIVEHDHSCCPLGKSCPICRRGLACPKCNTIIALANDDPERLWRIGANLADANAAVRERMGAQISH